MNSPARNCVCLFFLGLILLTGCAGEPIREPSGKARTMIALEERSESEPQRSRWFLQSAESLVAPDPLRARTQLQQVHYQGLDAEGQSRYWLARALVDLNLHEPVAAGRKLARVQPGKLSASARHTHAIVQARLATRQRSYTDAIVYWKQAVDQYQDLPGFGDRLWEGLLASDNGQLGELLAQEPGPSVQSWLELAILYAAPTPVTRKLQQLADWRKRWKNSGAGRFLPEAVGTLQSIPTLNPGTIALLLPLSGPRAQVGTAVRDGFMTAYYHSLESSDAAQKAPRIRFYDTQGAELGALLHRAQRDGAELIVGPLRRSLTTQAVQELGSRPDAVTVPWLLLNHVEDKPADRPVYQFSILSEDEAGDAAERAFQDGHRHPLLMTADSDWGQRAANSFNQRWAELGGTSLEHHVISKDQDYNSLVRRALLVSDSLERARDLGRLLGYPLDHTPRRREDVDAIFLAVSPKQGRGIKPALNYYFANDIPVYSVSNLYDGRGNPERDRDLDGIRLPLMPWLFDTAPKARAMARTFSGSRGPLAPFYALGFDSWMLYPQLAHMAALSDLPLAGATGRLRMTAGHRITRDLDWYAFRQGRPAPLGP